jgi:hypothetical protein
MTRQTSILGLFLTFVIVLALLFTANAQATRQLIYVDVQKYFPQSPHLSFLTKLSLALPNTQLTTSPIGISAYANSTSAQTQNSYYEQVFYTPTVGTVVMNSCNYTDQVYGNTLMTSSMGPLSNGGNTFQSTSVIQQGTSSQGTSYFLQQSRFQCVYRSTKQIPITMQLSRTTPRLDEQVHLYTLHPVSGKLLPPAECLSNSRVADSTENGEFSFSISEMSDLDLNKAIFLMLFRYRTITNLTIKSFDGTQTTSPTITMGTPVARTSLPGYFTIPLTLGNVTPNGIKSIIIAFDYERQDGEGYDNILARRATPLYLTMIQKRHFEEGLAELSIESFSKLYYLYPAILLNQSYDSLSPYQRMKFEFHINMFDVNDNIASFVPRPSSWASNFLKWEGCYLRSLTSGGTIPRPNVPYIFPVSPRQAQATTGLITFYMSCHAFVSPLFASLSDEELQSLAKNEGPLAWISTDGYTLRLHETSPTQLSQLRGMRPVRPPIIFTTNPIHWGILRRQVDYTDNTAGKNTMEFTGTQYKLVVRALGMIPPSSVLRIVLPEGLYFSAPVRQQNNAFNNLYDSSAVVPPWTALTNGYFTPAPDPTVQKFYNSNFVLKFSSYDGSECLNTELGFKCELITIALKASSSATEKPLNGHDMYLEKEFIGIQLPIDVFRWTPTTVPQAQWNTDTEFHYRKSSVVDSEIMHPDAFANFKWQFDNVYTNGYDPSTTPGANLSSSNQYAVTSNRFVSNPPVTVYHIADSSFQAAYPLELQSYLNSPQYYPDGIIRGGLLSVMRIKSNAPAGSFYANAADVNTPVTIGETRNFFALILPNDSNYQFSSSITRAPIKVLSDHFLTVNSTTILWSIPAFTLTTPSIPVLTLDLETKDPSMIHSTGWTIVPFTGLLYSLDRIELSYTYSSHFSFYNPDITITSGDVTIPLKIAYSSSTPPEISLSRGATFTVVINEPTAPTTLPIVRLIDSNTKQTLSTAPIVGSGSSMAFTITPSGTTASDYAVVEIELVGGGGERTIVRSILFKIITPLNNVTVLQKTDAPENGIDNGATVVLKFDYTLPGTAIAIVKYNGISTNILKDNLTVNSGSNTLDVKLPNSLSSTSTATISVALKSDSTIAAASPLFNLYTYSWLGVADNTLACQETPAFCDKIEIPTRTFNCRQILEAQNFAVNDDLKCPTDKPTTSDVMVQCTATNRSCGTGTCILFGNEGADTCQCFSGWIGPRCDAIQTVKCEQCNQQNLDRCDDTSEYGYCICKNGFTGDKCQFTTCEDCLNNEGYESCDTTTISTGKCICKEYWSGDNCDVDDTPPSGGDDDDCSQCVIENVQDCLPPTNLSPLGVCSCKPDWGGELCDEPIGQSPCNHCVKENSSDVCGEVNDENPNGTCICLNDSKLNLPWTGKNCEVSPYSEPNSAVSVGHYVVGVILGFVMMVMF